MHSFAENTNTELKWKLFSSSSSSLKCFDLLFSGVYGNYHRWCQCYLSSNLATKCRVAHLLIHSLAHSLTHKAARFTVFLFSFFTASVSADKTTNWLACWCVCKLIVKRTRKERKKKMLMMMSAHQLGGLKSNQWPSLLFAAVVVLFFQFSHYHSNVYRRCENEKYIELFKN